MHNQEFHQFSGTEGYVASRALQDVVNVAIALERPLLLKGEPGTGKTLLAHHIAKALGMEIILWNVKSTTKARDGLYTYDTVQRLNDARFGDGDVRDIRHYIKHGPLGRAFGSNERVVLLIDEVDKADIEFPNDLLFELDEMRFHILETDEWVKAVHRPVVIVTSNSEKELPDAFLRRCVFHYIDFPDEEQMRAIIDVHFPSLSGELMRPVHPIHSDIAFFAGMKVVWILLWLPIAAVLYLIFRPELHPTLLEVAVFFVAIWGAFLVRTMFLSILGIITFWTTRVGALYELYFALELILSGRMVPMALMRELGVAHDIVNVHGGACALGHPIGCSGARVLSTLIYALHDRGWQHGLATLCLGGGEAVAMAVEVEVDR